MERRGQERDIGMQSSMSYNPPQITQESPVKLPLAPIVSTPSDRRGNATVSTRRGSAIFSPTQVVDQHNHPPPHLRQQLNPPLPPLHLQKEPNPDPDPAPTATTATGGTSNSKTPPPPPSQPQAPPTQSQVPSPSPPPPPAAAEAEASESTFNNTSSVRYRECLKNHAAGIGGHIVDGCGEFMSSGEEGTPEALRCAACDCHRNFHRKEVKGEPQQSQYYPYNPNSGNNSNSHRNPLLLHNQTPSSLAPPSHLQKHHKHSHSQGGFATRPTHPTMVNFGGNGGVAAESSSEDLNMFQSGGGGGHAVIQPSISGSKKRFRTKFSQEQKDRMQEFATKLDWRIQKQDDEEVQQFCSEVGVKRQVFKVWMHNNKAMKKRQI